MATIQEVADALGDEAQVCAGSIVVYRDGKHILIARTTEDGFEVTEQGQALLDETVVTEDGSTVILAGSKKSKKLAAKEEVVEDAPHDPLAGL